MRLRRLLLVGFMGSGKSTVGPLLARALSWRFVDFDDRIEETDGRAIPDIFREEGEPYFREVEDDVARSLLGLDDVVLGSGGGWAAVPGRLRDLPAGTVSVWLRVSPHVAVQRSVGDRSRPLLSGVDALETAARLLAERAGAYADAQLQVDTDARTPKDVTETILGLLERDQSHAAAGMR